MANLDVRVMNDRLHIGPHFSMSFQRTLRIPEDDSVYPLPPGLGKFPIHRVGDFGETVPDDWQEHGGIFIPMYQREAMWLDFEVPSWRACAVKIAVGKVNAITGKPWKERIKKERKQDYIVCPDQPWLDGINAGEGFIRQFVAMPLGMGYTVEGQITGKEEHGGLQVKVFEPKPGRFPDEPPAYEREFEDICCACSASASMGLGAGGRMKQKVYPDGYGPDTWDSENTGRVYVHIANSTLYHEITGRRAPETPISASSYTEYGLPWFDLYDEHKEDLKPDDKLAGVKPISEKDKEHGFTNQQDDATVEIQAGQVKTLGDPTIVHDGKW